MAFYSQKVMNPCKISRCLRYPFPFLVASKRLYKPRCRSVGRSSVRLSVHRSVADCSEHATYGDRPYHFTRPVTLQAISRSNLQNQAQKRCTPHSYYISSFFLLRSSNTVKLLQKLHIFREEILQKAKKYLKNQSFL